jgi:hypothetical protein
MNTPNSANDHGLFQAPVKESSIPSGVDRRTFSMCSGVIGTARDESGNELKVQGNERGPIGRQPSPLLI